jgi:O-antigen ligase
LPGNTQLINRMSDQRGRRALITGNGGLHGSEIALLGILIATASIGFEGRLPVLSVGIHLRVPDILLLGLLGSIAVRWLLVPEFRIARTPLDRPLLIFYGVTLFSTLVAIVQSSVDLDQAIAAIRIFSYYLTFFVVTNLVRERRQLNFLVNGIFLLATVVAVAMVGQYVLGDSVQLVGSQIGAMEEMPGRTFGDVVRIAPPGYSIVMVSFVAILCTLVGAKLKPMGLLRFLQCGLMGMALLLTFFRSYWAALIVALFLAAYLVRGADRRRLIGWGVLGMFPAVLVLLVVFAAPDLPISRLVEASWKRLSTVNAEAFTGGDASYNYRRLENDYALPAIMSNPVIGLGMGAAYRPLDPRLDGYDPESLTGHTASIHNSHLGVLLQSGLLGYLSLMWLSLAFLLRGFRNWRKVPNDRMRAVVLGFTLVYLVVLIAAGANSIFMQWSWVPVLGIIMGINEVILRQVRPG